MNNKADNILTPFKTLSKGKMATTAVLVIATGMMVTWTTVSAQERVTICHKGKEIQVAAAAVAAHLAHGDTPSCSLPPPPPLPPLPPPT